MPWLTLIFMKRMEILRYLPAGIFGALTTTIIHDMGIGWGFWAVLQASYPLYEMLPYFYGLIPVLVMWIFKFTNGRIALFFLVNAVIDIGFAFYFLDVFLPRQGLYELLGVTPLGVWLINMAHATMLYAYQKLLEGELGARFLAVLRTPVVSSALSKPLWARKNKGDQN